MASNLIQKNTVFKDQKFTKIPFGDVNKLDLYSEDDSLNNMVILNNTYNQMIQNDKFVAAEIDTRMNETIGPKSDDEEKIYDGPNGYKFYSIEDSDPYIYQKVDTPIQDTFTQMNVDNGITFMDAFGTDAIVYSNSSKSYSSGQDFKNLALSELKYHYNIKKYQKSIEEDGDSADVQIYCSTKSDNKFLGGTLNNTGVVLRYEDTGLYFLNSDNDQPKTDENGNYIRLGRYLQKVNVFGEDTATRVTAIEYNQKTGQIAVATTEFIYLCDIDKNMDVTSSKKIYQITDYDEVVSIKFLNEQQTVQDYEILVLTKNRKLYYSAKGTVLTDSSYIQTTSISKICFELSSKQYYCLQDGIYIYGGEKISSTNNHNFTLAYQSSKKVILKDANGVYSFNGTNLVKLNCFNSYLNSITSLFCIGDDIVGCTTTDKIIYNRNSGIFDIGSIEMELDCMLSDHCIESIVSREIDDTPFVCFTSINEDATERKMAYVRFTSESESGYDTNIDEFPQIKVSDLDISDVQFKTIAKIGDRKYLIFTDTKQFLNFIDVTTDSYTTKKLYGIDCIGFTSYQDIGYVFTKKSIVIFENLGSWEFDYVQIPHNMELTNGIVDAASIDSSEEGFTSAKECNMVVLHDGKTDYLRMTEIYANSYGYLEDLSYKNNSDIFNIDGIFFQLNSSGELCAYSKGDALEDITIGDDIKDIYVGKTLADVSYPGYQDEGDAKYKVVTYVNTDKSYVISSEIEIGDELNVISKEIKNYNYLYAHVETAEANFGLFRTSENTAIKYGRFENGVSYTIPADDYITNKNINILQQKYIEDNDYLNNAPDSIVRTLQLGQSEWTRLVATNRGELHRDEESTPNTGYIVDTCYVALQNSSNIKMYKVECKTDFTIVDNYSTPTSTEDVPELTSTTFTTTGISIESTKEITTSKAQIFAFINGSNTCVSESQRMMLVVADGSKVILKDMPFDGSEAENDIEVELGQNIVGISKYDEDTCIVLTDTRAYKISKLGKIQEYSTLQNLDNVNFKSVYSLEFDNADNQDNDDYDYPYQVQGIGNHTIFFSENNSFPRILITDTNYIQTIEDEGLVLENLPSTMNGYGRLRYIENNTAILIKDGLSNHPIVMKIQIVDGIISYNWTQITSINGLDDIVCEDGGIELNGNTESGLSVKIYTPYMRKTAAGSNWILNIDDDSTTTGVRDIEVLDSESATLACYQTQNSNSGILPVYICEKSLYTSEYLQKNSVLVETITDFDSIEESKLTEILSNTPKHIYLDKSMEDILIVYHQTTDNIKVANINVYSQNVQFLFERYENLKEIMIPNEIKGSDTLQMYILLQKSSDGQIDINVVDKDGVTKLSETSDFDEDTIFGAFSFNSKIAKYYMSFGNGDFSKIMCFTGTGKNIVYLQQTRDSYDFPSTLGNAVDMERYSENNFMLVFEKMLYNYQFEVSDGQVLDWEYMTMEASSKLGKVSKYVTNSGVKYLIGDGKYVKESDNSRTWNIKYTLNQDNNSITNIYFKNTHDVMCLKTNSIWYSQYNYTLENNTPKFTENDALILFDGMQGEIENIISTDIRNHENNEHNNTKNIDKINKFLSVKPQFPDDFTSSYVEFDDGGNVDQILISDDYIQTILTGDSDDNVIDVGIRNTACGNVDEKNNRKRIDNVQYIAKCWNSGMVDLYIHIPTTYTYYIPHIEYAGYCTMPESEVRVNGKTLSANIKDNYTTITLNIISTYFHIDAILENTIKGASLPLKIFKGTEYQDEEGSAALLFHSFMEPSVAQFAYATEISAINDQYSLNYFCFGTDEQNIQLRFWDSEKNYLKKYKTIIYHGREGKDANGKDTVEQRILEDDPEKDIFGEGVFTSENGKFIGWTTKKKEIYTPNFKFTKVSYDDDDIKFADGVLHLYAIWLHYSFNEKDTIIDIDATANQNYTIAELEITPNMEIDGYNLKNQVYIDWDSDTKA